MLGFGYVVYVIGGMFDRVNMFKIATYNALIQSRNSHDWSTKWFRYIYIKADYI